MQILNHCKFQQEWLNFFKKNLENISGIYWADKLIDYLEDPAELEYNSQKFRSQVYYLKYQRQELMSSQMRNRLVHQQKQYSNGRSSEDFGSLHGISARLAAGSLQSRFTGAPANNNLIQQQSGELNFNNQRVDASASQFKNANGRMEVREYDPIEELYVSEGEDNAGLITERIQELDENLVRFLYSVDEHNKAQQLTLESMTVPTRQLFDVIKSQLLNPDHPLALLASRFAYYYVKHYTYQLLFDEKSNDFYLAKSATSTDIKFVSESERAIIEGRIKVRDNFCDYGNEDGENIVVTQQSMDEDEEQAFQEFRNNLLTQENKIRETSINSSFKDKIKRPTFSKTASEKKKTNSRYSVSKVQMFHKSAQEAILEVKQFLCLMYGAIVRFYNTTLKLSVLESMKEDLIDLITRMVFNEPMSHLVTAMCRMCTKDEERVYMMKVVELSGVGTQEIGLPKEFMLNEHSGVREVYQRQYGKAGVMQDEEEQDEDGDVGGSSSSNKRGGSFKQAQGVLMGEGGTTNHSPTDQRRLGMESAITEVNEEDEEERKETFNSHHHRASTIDMRDLTIVIQQKSSQSEPEVLMKLIEERLAETPYKTPINILKGLRSAKGPIDKARCVAQMSDSIVNSVNQFWQGLEMKENDLTIAADQLIMIYIYILLQQTQLQDIFAQIKFVNEFLTPYVKNSKLGYCMTTLEIAVTQINMLSREELIMPISSDSHKPSESDAFFNSASNLRHQITEARKSFNQSLRESVASSSRAMSLLIDKDLNHQYVYSQSRTGSNLSQSYSQLKELKMVAIKPL
ncbi:hypothetical protein FGO68_gene8005 [Halteria grandinella]|uniref:VPS9 domain-containing protein n=1 Tax=Halteria grandinella TaxID=5974 RepID=A0A8J8SWW9_HALGN|nr:hypothetical protein FGO68_gene8005 [Halteria grandinella]